MIRERAEEVISRLRRAGGEAATDPRVDLTESALFRARGGFERLVDAANRAILSGEQRGSVMLVARTKLDLGLAYRELSRLDDSVRVLSEAKAVFEERGDVGGAGAADMNTRHQAFADILLAEVASDRGDTDLAIERLRYASQIREANGEAMAVETTKIENANLSLTSSDVAGQREVVEYAVTMLRGAGLEPTQPRADVP